MPEGLTVDQLENIAHVIRARTPTAMLKKNQVGNLMIIVDEQYVGFVNLNMGDVEYLEDSND